MKCEKKLLTAKIAEKRPQRTPSKSRHEACSVFSPLFSALAVSTFFFRPKQQQSGRILA